MHIIKNWDVTKIIAQSSENTISKVETVDMEKNNTHRMKRKKERIKHRRYTLYDVAQVIGVDQRQ